MDVSMPRMDGVTATRIIRKEIPNTAVIIISQNDPKLVARRAAEADARSWISKSELGHALVPAIQRLETGMQPSSSQHGSGCEVLLGDE
jgi:DNA-binding NarL/FixJ family response regulator